MSSGSIEWCLSIRGNYSSERVGEIDGEDFRVVYIAQNDTTKDDMLVK